MSDKNRELGRALEALEKCTEALERLRELFKEEPEKNREDPEFWPPQIGDAWEAEGEVHFAMESGSGTWFVMESGSGTRRSGSGAGGYIVTSCHGSAWFAPGYVNAHSLKRFRDMKPVLVYRKAVL